MVLVTGATGFVGSRLVKRLLDEGASVRILRRESSPLDLLGESSRRVEHAVGNVTDTVAVADAVSGVDQVFHAAAFVGFGGRRDRERLMRVNVDGTSVVVNAALRCGVGRLLHVSSMAAFGRPDRTDELIDESTQWQRSKANTDYAYSKYLAELEVRRGIAEGLDAVIVNPALIFGVGRPGDNTRRIVDRVRHEKLPAIPSGGTNVVDVLDVVDATVRAMASGTTGERYFLGSQNLSWEEIIHTLADAFDVDPPYLKLGRRAAVALAYASEAVGLLTRSRPLVNRETARTSTRTYKYDNSKAREQLRWQPRPFSATAQRIAEELEGEAVSTHKRGG